MRLSYRLFEYFSMVFLHGAELLREMRKPGRGL
jgi:hypothetical protein